MSGIMIWGWGQTKQTQEITNQDVMNYWATLSEDERINLIRDCINIVNADPVITDPDWYGIVTGPNITVFHNNEIIMNVASLKYKIKIDPIEIKNIIPENAFPWLTVGLISGGCLILGFVFGIVIK
jgi:hypothetical protein